MSKSGYYKDIGRLKVLDASTVNIMQDNKLYIERLSDKLPGASHYNFRETWLPKGIAFGKGQGITVTDITGKEYLDFYSNFGSNIFGHAYRDYMNQVFDKILQSSSTSLSSLSLEVVERLTSHIPSMEMIRFCVTGTEAVQAAIRVSRAYTGKQKFIRFNGNYHGHLDNMLGGKPSDDSCPYPVDFEGDPRASLGLAEGVREKQSILLPWNDITIVEKILSVHHSEIACIITEPVSLNGGGIEPRSDYLVKLRALCDRYKVVLIFDEVITGFRVSLGGAQKLYNVKPDITILGKALGGGMVPVAALGGRAEIFELFARNQVVHAGTFNGYHAGLAAILATLNILERNKGGIERIFENGLEIQNILRRSAQNHGVPITFQAHPSCFYIHITDKKLEASEQWTPSIKASDNLFQKIMMENSIIFAPVSRCYPAIVFSDMERAVLSKNADTAFEILGKLLEI